MKVVVDTNAIVSGLLNAFSPPGEIVRMIASSQLNLCYDARIIAEYGRVLNCGRFPFAPDEIEILIGKIEQDGLPSPSFPLKTGLPDRNDEKFLEVALGGEAEFLITGNLKHFPAQRGIRIVSPREFLLEMRKRR